MKDNDFTKDVKYVHKKTMRYLRYIYNLVIWKKSSENTYYYKINPFLKKIKISSNDEFLKLIDKHIKVYENIKDVYLNIKFLLLANPNSLYIYCKRMVLFPVPRAPFIPISFEVKSIFE